MVARYLITLRWKIAKKILSPLDTLITTMYYQSLVVEIISLLIVPYPGIENVTYTESYPDKGVVIFTPINYVLLFLAMLIRIYLFIRFVLTYSKHKNARSQRLCIINGTQASFMYSIKAMMKEQPHIFLTGALVLPTILGAYWIRIFERPLIPTSG